MRITIRKTCQCVPGTSKVRQWPLVAHTHTLDIVSHYAHIVRDCQKQLATGREPSSFSPINSHYSAHCSESMAILCRFSVKSEPAVKGDCLSVPPHPCGAQLTNWRTDRRCQQMMSKCEDGTAAVQASSLPSAASSANYNAIALEVCTLSDWPFTFTHCPPLFLILTRCSHDSAVPDSRHWWHVVPETRPRWMWPLTSPFLSVWCSRGAVPSVLSPPSPFQWS